MLTDSGTIYRQNEKDYILKKAKMIKFKCKHCNIKLLIPNEFIGEEVTCLECGKTIIIPKNSDPNVLVICGGVLIIIFIILCLINGDNNSTSSIPSGNLHSSDGYAWINANYNMAGRLVSAIDRIYYSTNNRRLRVSEVAASCLILMD